MKTQSDQNHYPKRTNTLRRGGNCAFGLRVDLRALGNRTQQT
jgi:hypothetical protein